MNRKVVFSSETLLFLDEKGRQVFNLNVTNFNWASFSTSFVTQNQDLKFQLINKDIRNRVNGKRQDKKDWGIRVMSKGQLLYGFMAKVMETFNEFIIGYL